VHLDCQVAGMHARAAGPIDHHGDDSRRIGHAGLVVGGALAKHGHLARRGDDQLADPRGAPSATAYATKPPRLKPNRPASAIPNRIRHAVSSEMPLTSPNCGISRCQPRSADGTIPIAR